MLYLQGNHRRRGL